VGWGDKKPPTQKGFYMFYPIEGTTRLAWWEEYVVPFVGQEAKP
jgi:hypothetical protein